MVKIVWLQSARDDVKEIVEYIAKDSKHYARKQLDSIKQSTQILKTQPKSGKMVQEFGDQKVLEIISGRYRIIYTVISLEEVHILMVHHGARRLPRLK